MGLQGQLNDVSSDSIPLLLVALIANCFNSLRSFLFGLLQSTGIYRFGPAHVEDGLLGSGLAGLIVLAEQLNLNRLFSYRYCCNRDCGNKCVVCLSMLRDGDQVRELSCRHVFHKDCFDGWLDHLNFNCPLCRSPLVSDERVTVTRRRVGEDLVAWFPIR
ncbi:E3 ubiquitin-protein ligase RHA2A [Tripterygium wilfordii]|uniref:E3 ubiquitin-protein ligase RHA2A n=1 Tax=Tripterygium wilfordii TaxID=458696 RepID=UPI0018F814D6|nr:E3 ubiquitin-protein ligase RHA2A [Tripterygium wilfordii]